jgi:hypothetical protein
MGSIQWQDGATARRTCTAKNPPVPNRPTHLTEPRNNESDTKEEKVVEVCQMWKQGNGRVPGSRKTSMVITCDIKNFVSNVSLSKNSICSQNL